MAPAGRSALAGFTDWITKFGEGWESADAEAAGSLFAVGATLQSTPFSDLLRGRRQILEYLAGMFAEWPRAGFSAQVLGAGDTYGVAHWRVAVEGHAMDGVLLAALDDRGRCTSLRLWWHDTRTNEDGRRDS